MGSVDPGTLRAELRGAIQGLGPAEFPRRFKIPLRVSRSLRCCQRSEIAEPGRSERARQFAVSAEGSVRFDFDISGVNEAEAALAGFPKPDGWNLNLATACDDARTIAAPRMRDAPSNCSPRRPQARPPRTPCPPAWRADSSTPIAARWTRRGAWETGLPRGHGRSSARAALPGGTAGHRLSAQVRDRQRRVPPRRATAASSPCARREVRQAADSEKAVEHFLALPQRPARRSGSEVAAESRLHDARHLSGGVPKQYLFTAGAFASAEDIGRFKDVAPAAGLNFFSMAAGIIVDDFDHDGLLDVVTSSFDMCAPMHFFHNNGDGTFADRIGKVGPRRTIGRPQHRAGRLQQRWLPGHSGAARRLGDSAAEILLRNNCNGTFHRRDQGERARRADQHADRGVGRTSITTACWISTWATRSGPNQLFLNNGDGTFKDISHSSGTDIAAFTKAW